jgi:hypothetical protein
VRLEWFVASFLTSRSSIAEISDAAAAPTRKAAHGPISKSVLSSHARLHRRLSQQNRHKADIRETDVRFRVCAQIGTGSFPLISTGAVEQCTRCERIKAWPMLTV